MGIHDKYNSLHRAERDFLFTHPIAAMDFNRNADVALKEAQRRFGAPTLHNGSGDAFRHCFWSAMNARDHGPEIAKQFGNAHEDWAGNPTGERAMDLHNNNVGYAIGAWAIAASDRHLAVLCVGEWASGKLVQLDGRNVSDLVYSNRDERRVYLGTDK